MKEKLKTKHIYLTQIVTYEYKIHKISSIRMKAEQFTMEKYDYGPDPRTILLKFDINHQ